MRVIYGINKDADSSTSSNSQSIIPKEKWISKLASESKYAFDNQVAIDSEDWVRKAVSEQLSKMNDEVLHALQNSPKRQGSILRYRPLASDIY